MNTLLIRTGRDAAFLTVGLVTSVVAFAVWLTAVVLCASLSVFVVGLPIFLASAVAWRWTAELDRRNAGWWLGRPLWGRYRDHHRPSFLARVAATAKDPQVWRDLAWLITHSVLGFAFGVAAVTLVATVIGLAVLPAWYWALPEGADFGLWTADTLGAALASALLAIPLAMVTVPLLRGMAWAEARIAASLLDQ